MMPGSRSSLIALATALCVALPATAGQARETGETPRPLLTTGITGTITASGKDDPQYLLSFRPVQHLILEATRGPLDAEEAEATLESTPVSTEDLLRLDLLRREGGRLRLAYLVLTVEDQVSIHHAAERFGASLAEEFMARRAELQRLLERYPHEDLRPDLAFGLIAGMILNWEGLKLSTELGYRPDETLRPNGDRYLVHSAELGATPPSKGLYSGSHSYPGSVMSFSTFGDGPSIPRLRGVPDILTTPIERGLELLEDRPIEYAAARTEFITYIVPALDDAGAVMRALASGPAHRESILSRTDLNEGRLAATLGLLEAMGYVGEVGGSYEISVAVLTERDRALVEGILSLGRRILDGWLRESYPGMQADLAGLSPMKNGLPFQLVFSEVWHDVFGFATKVLAERGFYRDPRREGYAYDGYVPLVWESSLNPL